MARPLGPKQAAMLAWAARGFIHLAGPAADDRRHARLIKDGLLDHDGRLTDAGRATLTSHVEAGRPIDGMQRKEDRNGG